MQIVCIAGIETFFNVIVADIDAQSKNKRMNGIDLYFHDQLPDLPSYLFGSKATIKLKLS